MSLFQELKRRKVVRTTIAYLAGGFVAAQATQLLVDGLGLPAWILKAVLITIVVALPLVIGLAWAFDLTAEGVARTHAGSGESLVTLRWRRIALPAVASLLLLTASVAFLALNRSSEPALNQDLVAVMPFRVSGDAQIEYLREGIVDLLAAKLTGEGGPRAADPRAVISAVKQESDEGDVAEVTATEIARKLGAGRVLVGSVVGTAQQFQISAKILQVANGRLIAQEEQSGSADSLFTTVDRLVAKLLSLQAGEGPQRLEVLTTTSLPALRAYIDGQAAYRSGHFGRAVELFGRAVEIDSTFALAALGQDLAGGWGEGPVVDEQRVRRLMWTYRDRLGPVDRALVTAVVGDSLGSERSWALRIADHEAVVTLAPDRADAWFGYGDIMSHWGAVAGYVDATDRSDVAFSRVLELDSTYMPALLHRMDNAALRGRPDLYRKLDGIRLRIDPEGTAAEYQSSWRSHFLADAAAIAAERAALDTMSAGRLAFASWIGGTAPGAVDDAVRAIEQRARIAHTQGERIEANFAAVTLYMTYGMPSRAAQAFEELAAALPNPAPARMMQVMGAIYGNADSASAERAVRQLDELVASRVPSSDRHAAVCVLEHWRLWRGQTQTYQATLQTLSRVQADSARQKRHAGVCIQTLRTIYAMHHDPTSLLTEVRALDAMMREGPPIDRTLGNVANIVLGRAAERAGDRKLAYHAMARTAYHAGAGLFLHTMVRECARLAALNGNPEHAIRAYTWYLRAHERAEPAVKPDVDAARAHLAQITGERS